MGELFTLQYNKINASAKNITRCRSERLAPDLINSTYLELYGKEHPKDPEQFVKWFCKVMSLQFRFTNSYFNAVSQSKAVEQKIELIEEKKEDSKEERIELLGKFKKSLPLHLQLIFDLHFLNGLSGYNIADQLNSEGYDTHRKRVDKWVNEIKLKLDKWKKQQK